ncbi:AMIN-like domain-containing (lipo)protein [Lentzea aerocolonigenes]|nr:hypothetical protein [Lentzea aerocolonigenes]
MKKFLAGLAAVVMAVTIVPSASAAGTTLLTNVRTGHHPTFDRVVFDLTGAEPGASVTRTTEPTSCGSGKPVSALGEEFLEVRLQPAAAHENGHSTYPGSRKFETGLPTAQSVAFTCDFEAVLSIAIGVNRKNASYHAWFTTDGPLRYVVDIDHN